VSQPDKKSYLGHKLLLDYAVVVTVSVLSLDCISNRINGVVFSAAPPCPAVKFEVEPNSMTAAVACLVRPDGHITSYGCVIEVTRYMVQVETGDTNDFEPITDVYIILYGERGDSGLRYLSKNKEGGQQFELFKVSRLVK